MLKTYLDKDGYMCQPGVVMMGPTCPGTMVAYVPTTIGFSTRLGIIVGVHDRRVNVLWATVDFPVDPNVGYCDLWVEWGIPLTKGQMKRREGMCKLTVDCGKPQA